MILYTIMPIEKVLENLDRCDENKPKEIQYLGETVEVIPVSNGYMIHRLISTAPKAFLNPKLQPGNIIKGKY